MRPEAAFRLWGARYCPARHSDTCKRWLYPSRVCSCVPLYRMPVTYEENSKARNETCFMILSILARIIITKLMESLFSLSYFQNIIFQKEAVRRKGKLSMVQSYERRERFQWYLVERINVLYNTKQSYWVMHPNPLLHGLLEHDEDGFVWLLSNLSHQSHASAHGQSCAQCLHN